MLNSDTSSAPRIKGDPPAAVSPDICPDRRELALVAVERTHMPMVVADMRRPDIPIVLANPAFLALTGYAAEEVIGRNCRFLQGPDTDPAAVAAIRAAIREHREATITLLNYRKDGSTFWNELHLSPIRDDAGEVIYAFASQRDVTNVRKTAKLAASELRLLREVDHRAMNVLALVDGIVRLSRADDPVRYSTAVQGRVQALARAHRMLAQRGWKAAPFQDVLKTEIDPLDLKDVTLTGPAVDLPANYVQPIALVVHELLDNALTHGALSAPQGALNVRWWIDPESRRLCVNWRETGGPPPPAERQTGFGWTMVTGIVKRQLAGSVTPHWPAEGLQLDITLPLRAA